MCVFLPAIDTAMRATALLDNIGVTALAMSAEELAKLEEVSALPAEYPGWMPECQTQSRIAKVFVPKT
jgi:hypothetical protein